jgi:transketolase
MLDLLVEGIPELLGGSADLTGSNLTAGKTSRAWHNADHGTDVNYISYGVREFGMAAIMNGVALHGGLIPYGGTFAVFSDYARNAIRMSALMKQRVVHVLTHDSIGLGEDGPTHQPIEHAAVLRLIPDLHVWRPCDGFETAVAWSTAIERTDGPSALLLSRQNLPQLSSTNIDPANTIYVSANLIRNSNNTSIIKNTAVPINDSVSLLTGKLIIQAGDAFTSKANANGVSQLILSYLETANQ